MNARGFSLAEVLVSVGILLLLLLAVGSVLIQTLHLQAFHAGRASMGRTAAELSERLVEEARSSTAVFIPGTDVHSAPNGGTSGLHEVDFFRRLSAGGNAFVGYGFDATTGDVTRYEFTPLSGAAKILNADVVASDLASFSVVREKVADSGAIVGESDPAQVTILYGKPELAGGNDLIVASFTTRPSGGVPGRAFTVHLASRAAPTALAILAPKGAIGSPAPTKVIPFVILRRGVKPKPPHGPGYHGYAGWPPPHAIAAAGSAEFVGLGSSGVDWLEVSADFESLTSGVYVYKDSGGASITAMISCSEGSCPAFRPVPVSAAGGSVVFQMAR